MVAMPPDPAAVSARTLRENCLPGRCGPRAAPIIETRRDLNPRDRRKLGEKPRQALRKRKAQAPCERRPSRVRIHIAAWFHAPDSPESPHYYASSPYGVVRPHHLGVFVTLRAGMISLACDSTLACHARGFKLALFHVLVRAPA